MSDEKQEKQPSQEEIQEELAQLDAETFEIEDVADLEQNAADEIAPVDGGCTSCSCSSCCSTCSSTCSSSCS
jgi:thiazolylpeptide-type bacteriocin precursor